MRLDGARLNYMKLFTVKLTDEERDALEAHRAALGLRSQSDVVRRWIATPPRQFEPTGESWPRDIPQHAWDAARKDAVAQEQRLSSLQLGLPKGAKLKDPQPAAPGSRLKKR